MNEKKYALKPEDYSWVTDKMFYEKLCNLVEDMDDDELLGIPGVVEVLASALNNQILEALKIDKNFMDDKQGTQQVASVRKRDIQ